MSTILLSIKPEYSDRIFDGIKKYEYRRHIPTTNVEKIIVYSTAPLKKVVGEVEVINTLSMKKTSLWEITKSYAGISREGYRAYFKNSKIANAFSLGRATRYDEPKELADYDINQAPQSFVYLPQCPFCGKVLAKKKSKWTALSQSEEHIIPLSLGNDKLVLPAGTVCDDCNNYFALNIEKDFLNIETIRKLRSYHVIESRKKKVPDLDIEFGLEKTKLEFSPRDNCCFIGLSAETIDLLKNGQIQYFYSSGINIDELKNNYSVSRFLVKVFLEMCLFYALQFSSNNSPKKIFSFDEKMKDIVHYVRDGDRNKKIYMYSEQQYEKVKPFSNNDFIASVKLEVDQKSIVGMTLRLYELEFKLDI